MTDFKQTLNKFQQGAFAECVQDLAPFADSYAQQLMAECHLELGDCSEAYKHYISAGLKTQAGFCLVLERRFTEAMTLYKESPFSPARKWGVFLCEFFDKNCTNINSPGFLSFRIFLESTIFYMLQQGLYDLLDTLLAESRNIEDLFPEFRKYFASAYSSYAWYLRDQLPAMPANARAFQHKHKESIEGLFKKAIEIFQKAQKDYPYDAEIFFKLGQTYLLKGELKSAKQNFKKTIRILPGHIASTIYLKSLR